MADTRRVARVAEMIRREVSQLLFSGIKDDRVGTGMVSVTNVNVSGDLQHAKVFVSIYGTEDAKAQTMEGLQAATGYVRGELGRRMRLRRTPEIIFLEDRGLEEGTRIISLINKISRDSEKRGQEDDHQSEEALNSGPADQAEPAASPQDDDAIAFDSIPSAEE
ncbi:MAG: 30S ribosome-binding factor RbfA [Elainellaceae cyanobacterium]